MIDASLEPGTGLVETGQRPRRLAWAALRWRPEKSGGQAFSGSGS